MMGLPQVANLIWQGDSLRVLDQRALPVEERYLECRRWPEVVEAISSLAVRGAPAIGIAGGYGVVLAAARGGVPSDEFQAAVRALASARPTAHNLSWAVKEVARAASDAGGRRAAAAALDRAQTIHREDIARCDAIAVLGAGLLAPGGWVMTHCHTGSLATGGVGTALGAISRAFAQGRLAGVYACETRPLWQGARLTAWECRRLGIPCRLLGDGAAGALLSSGAVSAVLVGADRIAANGDVANKIGTYGLAVLATHHEIPFFVLAPCSTVDPATRSGADIPVEQRDAAEVLMPFAAQGVGAYNPAFDITPGTLVSAIVTEAGVHRRPYHLTAGSSIVDIG